MKSKINNFIRKIDKRIELAKSLENPTDFQKGILATYIYVKYKLENL